MKSVNKTKPTVKVRSFCCQPKRAELREEEKFNTTTEKLAKSVLQQIQVTEEKIEN